MNLKFKLKKICNKKSLLVGLVLACFFLNVPNFALSEDANLTQEEINQIKKNADKIDDKIDDKQDELETLEKKAEKYRALINEKKKQKATLENQLKMVDIEIDKVSNDISIIKEEITRNEREISGIERNIDIKNIELEKRKGDLRQMMQLFYQMDENFTIEYLSNRGDAMEVFKQSEYLVQTSNRIGDLAQEVERSKKALENDKALFEEKKKQLVGKKEDLDDRNSSLSSEKVGKQVLIQETQGEELKYQKLLSRIEEQKQDLLGDIDELSDDKKSELRKIQADSDKPAEKASTSWYYSQKDDRWGYNKIGSSSTLMKDYGCAITSVAMVLTFHGEKITPGKLSKEKIFRWDLIVWPRSWGSVKLISSVSHGNIDWKKLDENIEKGNPVIVFVKSKGRAGHYVVVHSKDKKDYIVHDPLFGANIYLETTKKLVGAIYNSSTRVEQMIIYEK